jgi:hypothetical protein
MTTQLLLELDQDTPPAGRIVRQDGSVVDFRGWTGLAAAIGSMTDDAPVAEDDATRAGA